MKEITILSGKGGTGKTSVTAALASVAKNVVFCDNDVDAADLHLIFNPQIMESYAFDSGSKAVINTDDCLNCGFCVDHCRLDAIHLNSSGQLEVNNFQCEGCRLCERVCPAEAISMIENNNNFWYVSETRFGTLIHAKMGPGEENSGKLVTEVRRKAKEIAVETKADFIINDGPPGIGCSAIASVTGTDLVLIVIEPTLSGLHDASRLVELAESFKIPIQAVINKFDINPEITGKVEKYLSDKNIQLAGKLPFEPKMVESMVAEKTIIEFAPAEKISREIYSIWKKIAVNLT
ncbi:MAG TPA: (4Fe-4S)-binding protein [Prolixibacteraceae bacterium]|nr:(4Fe-4S)-binding protein [Prolixibacteraceae bacterium]